MGLAAKTSADGIGILCVIGAAAALALIQSRKQCFPRSFMLSSSLSAGALVIMDVRGSGHQWVVYFADGKPLQVMLPPPPPLGPQIRGHLKLLVLAYTLIRTRQRYHDPGAGYYDPRQRDKLAHRFQAPIERLTSITKP